MKKPVIATNVGGNQEMMKDEVTGFLVEKGNENEIIEKIQALVHNDESINKTFKDFRDLQIEWHDIGMVSQKSLNSLWETYNYHVEKFYDYIKINKETILEVTLED